MELSIIIPAYNEENRISKTLESYGNFYYKKYKNLVEIIIIVNGSKDNTIEIVNQYSKKYPIIKGYEYKSKIGKGGALIEGLKKAGGNLIGYVDADLATSPEAFYDLISKINGYDGIIASRWMKGSIINKKQPLSRLIASRGFNYLVRLLLGLKYKDTQCGAKLFTKKAINSVINDLKTKYFSFDIDLLYNLKKNKLKIIEVPTIWNDHEKSTLIIRNTIPNMFMALMRIRLYHSRFKFILTAYDKLKSSYFTK